MNTPDEISDGDDAVSLAPTRDLFQNAKRRPGFRECGGADLDCTRSRQQQLDCVLAAHHTPNPDDRYTGQGAITVGHRPDRDRVDCGTGESPSPGAEGELSTFEIDRGADHSVHQYERRCPASYRRGSDFDESRGVR